MDMNLPAGRQGSHELIYSGLSHRDSFGVSGNVMQVSFIAKV
jgi:hypothetical protein